MSWQEQFPNTNLTYCEILQEDKRQGICTGMIEQEECLKKHLSKQRVKDAIDKQLKYCYTHDEKIPLLRVLKELELGLED